MDYISKTSNELLRAQARESLRGVWGLAIGTSVVYFIILFALQHIPFGGSLVLLLIAGPMQVGIIIFSLALSRKQNPHFTQIFYGFRKFVVALGAYLLELIFVFLWTVLLIVPGIIASISYAMTFYIIAENDSIGPLEAIRKSKELMQGNKWKLFCLGCRFVGWFLLCIPTLGIGFLWLGPYIMVSLAKFYDDLVKKEAADKPAVISMGDKVAVACSLVLIISFLFAATAATIILRARAIANDAAAKETVKSISIAIEKYARANNGKYPMSESDLIDERGLYLSKYYGNKPISGYRYLLELDADSYRVVAKPESCKATGTKVITAIEGGVIKEEECESSKR